MSPDFAPADARRCRWNCRLACTPPFLLHVGDLHERRNLPMLVEAMLEARRHFGGSAAVSLVLAGVDRGVGDGLCAIAARSRDA